MSQSTPPNDDSESNRDRLGDSSLIQPQYTYHRFLTSLLAYPRAAYNSIQLPSSGIGNANEISALSSSPDKSENPSTSVSSVSQQDAVGPRKDNRSPNTPETPDSFTPTSQANMLNNARDVRIGDQAVLNNNSMAIRCGDNSLLSILVIIAFICLSIFLLFHAIYHRSPTANPSTNIFPDFPPLHYTNGHGAMNGLGRLEPFVSHGAINGSDAQDPTRQVHPGTRDRVLSQIKAWIDNPNATKHILWLHGPAGVGKSTIAQTITRSYTTEKIPANFFFFHSDPKRNDGNRLFTTLAWQFTSSIPAIKPHIARSLIEQPDLPTKDVETQFQELIVGPFEALSNDMRPPHLSNMVVVIDGVDECVNTRLQERFLEVIGNIATNTRVPLRFLVFSRPEAHINDTINRFERHTLLIDLVEYAEADNDIETYFKDKFTDIAKRQDIDSTMWPRQGIIQQLVTRASGQFIYASTVIAFVGDEDNSAKTQLDIVLGLQPPTTPHPFAVLDRVYIKILEEQSDQKFLKTFLHLLFARHLESIIPYRRIYHPDGDREASYFPSFLCSRLHLHPSYGILMDMTEQVLHRKLRKMRSLLKLTPDTQSIDLHHRSFFEFLKDPTRSRQYSISTEDAAKQQLVSVIASLVRAVEQTIGQPNYHPPIPDDFGTGYYDVLSGDEIFRPLLKYQGRLLNLPNIVRNECDVFHAVNYLLSGFSLYQDRETNIRAVRGLELEKNLLWSFSSLLTYFRRLKGIFDLMIIFLSTEPEVVAMRVRSWSEAQYLMDLAYLVVDGKSIPSSLWGEDTTRKAVQLAFEIHSRVSVLPRFINFAAPAYTIHPYFMLLEIFPYHIEAFSKVLLISNFLDHRYVSAVTWKVIHVVDDSDDTSAMNINVKSDEESSIVSNNWRKGADPSYKEIMSIMLNLARTIQYFHSMGFVLSDRINLTKIYVDSRFRVRIPPTELFYGHYSQERQRSNIHTFGTIFILMYFDTFCTTSQAIGTSLTSLYKPKSCPLEDAMWQLILRCSLDEGKPTIDEVVQDIESWNVSSWLPPSICSPFCVTGDLSYGISFSFST